jgi:hypothetical protein
LKEAIATQILLGLLLEHYVVFIDGVSLKSERDTWGGSLVSGYFVSVYREHEKRHDLAAFSSFIYLSKV